MAGFLSIHIGAADGAAGLCSGHIWNDGCWGVGAKIVIAPISTWSMPYFEATVAHELGHAFDMITEPQSWESERFAAAFAGILIRGGSPDDIRRDDLFWGHSGAAKPHGAWGYLKGKAKKISWSEIYSIANAVIDKYSELILIVYDAIISNFDELIAGEELVFINNKKNIEIKIGSSIQECRKSYKVSLSKKIKELS